MNLNAPCDPTQAGLLDSGDLFLTAAASSTDRRLRHVISAVGLEYHQPFPKVMKVCFSTGELAKFSTACSDTLEASDQQSIRCRLSHRNEVPTYADMMNALTLTDMISALEGHQLCTLLNENRLATYFQPIVRCESPQQVFAYECLLRGFDEEGQLILPFHLYAVARATQLLPALDESARLTAIQSARRNTLDTAVFINFNPRSIDNSLTHLRTTHCAASQSTLSPDQFVFEVVESESITRLEELLRILNSFREAGYRVALDDLGAGYSSLNLLAQIKPDFVKLDMGLIRDVDCDGYKSHVAAKVLELAHDLGVQSIVEGVEFEGEWQWALEHGADFAQGYLFGRPGPSPPASEFSPSVGEPTPARLPIVTDLVTEI